MPVAFRVHLQRKAVVVSNYVNRNWSTGVTAVVTPLALTVTFTMPAGSFGEIAVMRVDELTVKLFAATVPKCTAVTALKPLPRIFTIVPPAAGPLVGLTLVIDGGAA
jgi:hypothetical protein